MASDTGLHNWVSDKLHESMGMSDKHAVDYLISLAKKTKDIDKYISTLGVVLGDDHNFDNVAKEIWNKIPRKEQTENVNRVKEREAMAQQQKFASYKMLSDSEEEAVPVKKKKKEKKKKNIRKRKSESSESETEEVPQSKQMNKQKETSSDESTEEKDRQKDLQERDEFAKRLKKRDKERTRNLVEKPEKKAFEQAKKRLKMEEEDRKRIMPELRDRARKEYVRKRKVEKVETLREDIEDDEHMFDDTDLTEREKLERQYKKKVFLLLCFFTLLRVEKAISTAKLQLN